MINERLFPYNVIICPCGCGLYSYKYELVYRLIDAHYSIDADLRVNSWCRCRDYNKQKGGSEVSSHLVGEAVDILCVGATDRYYLLRALIQAGFKRIIVYDEHIHADISKTKTSPYLVYERY